MWYVIIIWALLLLIWWFSILYWNNFMFYQIRKWLIEKKKTITEYKERMEEIKIDAQKKFQNKYFLESILIIEGWLNDFLIYYTEYEELLDNLYIEGKELKKQRKYLEIWKYFNKKIKLYANILNRTEHIVLFYNNIVNMYVKMTNNKNSRDVEKFDGIAIKKMIPTIDNFKDNYNKAILTVKIYQK